VKTQPQTYFGDGQLWMNSKGSVLFLNPAYTSEFTLSLINNPRKYSNPRRQYGRGYRPSNKVRFQARTGKVSVARRGQSTSPLTLNHNAPYLL